MTEIATFNNCKKPEVAQTPSIGLNKQFSWASKTNTIKQQSSTMTNPLDALKDLGEKDVKKDDSGSKKKDDGSHKFLFKKNSSISGARRSIGAGFLGKQVLTAKVKGNNYISQKAAQLNQSGTNGHQPHSQKTSGNNLLKEDHSILKQKEQGSQSNMGKS